MTVVDYDGSRLVADDRRDAVWRSLRRYRFSAMIRAWLAAPFKPIGEQMLVRARPRR